MNIKELKSGSTGATNIVKTFFKYSNILALLGIVITLILFLISDKKKELTFSIDSFISLVDKDNISSSGITVTFDSIQVNNLYKVNCSITNTGDAAITKNDIVENIKISLGPEAKLLKYHVEQVPKTIKTNDKKEGNTLTLIPDLLNSNDKINLSLYYTEDVINALPKTESRIVGGKILTVNKSIDINNQNKFVLPLPSWIENFLIWGTFIWNILFFIFLSTIFVKTKSGDNTIAYKIGFIIGVIIFLTGASLNILYFLSNDIL